jgi:hypothetical protein
MISKLIVFAAFILRFEQSCTATPFSTHHSSHTAQFRGDDDITFLPGSNLEWDDREAPFDKRGLSHSEVVIARHLQTNVAAMAPYVGNYSYVLSNGMAYYNVSIYGTAVSLLRLSRELTISPIVSAVPVGRFLRLHPHRHLFQLGHSCSSC